MFEYIILIAVIVIALVLLITFIYIACSAKWPPKHNSEGQTPIKWGLFSKEEEEPNLDWDTFDIFQDSHTTPPKIFPSQCVVIQPRTYEDLQQSEEKLAESTGTSSETDEAAKKPCKLKFTLKYNTVRSTLAVHVLGVQNAPRRGKGDVAYYVTLRIFPKAHRTFHTRAIESGTPMQLNEIFEFEIPEAELVEQNLKIMLSHFDRYSHHEVDGELRVELAELEPRGLILSREILLCKEMNKVPNEQPGLGEVMLSLGYLRLAERLTVVVISAKNLPLLETGRRPDPYVEVLQYHGGRLLKHKKTSCRIKDCSPVFNQSLTFHIPHGMLHQTTLLVSVKNDAGVTIDDNTLGQVLLGPEATGIQFEHWNEMRVNNKPVARWHKLQAAIKKS